MGKRTYTYGVLFLVTCLLIPLSFSVLGHKEAYFTEDEHSKDQVISGSLIARPQQGYLYVHDREITPLGGRITVIIGGITIKAHERRDVLFDKVEFLIDRQIKNSDIRHPFQWNWNERAIGWHTITLIGYIGDRSLRESLSPFVYNTQTR